MSSKGIHTHCCYFRRKFSDSVAHLKATIDHFWPSSRSGYNVSENKLKCCHECNQWKADKMPIDWLGSVERFFQHKTKFGTYRRTDYAQIIGSIRFFLKDKRDKNISIYKP
jgi:CRISPR/Cas system Type II protein with McrA/HNH and RuvC-like nuclease domain